MKKYNRIKIQFVCFNEEDIIMVSNPEFLGNINDNDIGNDGFLPF